MGERTCPECGAAASRESDFCLGCGRFLNWSDAERDETPPDRTATMTAPRWLTEAAGGAAVTVPVQTALRPGGCPRCGTPNPPERRFCGRCALEFRPAAAPPIRVERPGGPAGWWARLTGRGRTPAERLALRAYRRSLPLRFRLFRMAGVVVVLALLAAAVLALRGDPAGWVRDRWDDVRDTTVAVPARAALDPAGPERPSFASGFAVDNVPTTAWGTGWADTPGPPSCGAPRTTAGLLLTLDRPADLRKVRILAGLPANDGNRLLQWRPRTLEVRTDSACQLVPVDDSGAVQEVALDPPVSTATVRIDVVAVYPRAEDSPSDVVAISEIALLARPPH